MTFNQIIIATISLYSTVDRAIPFVNEACTSNFQFVDTNHLAKLSCAYKCNAQKNYNKKYSKKLNN